MRGVFVRSLVALLALAIVTCSASSNAWRRIKVDNHCNPFATVILRTHYEVPVINGSVGPIAGVQVAVSRLGESKMLASTISDDRGRFSFPPLAPGWYQLETCKEGFNSVAVAVRVLPGARESRIDLKLTVGA